MKTVFSAPLLLLCFSFSWLANAHELVLKTTPLENEPNQLNIDVLMTEVYIKAHRLPPEDTRLGYWKNQRYQTLTLSPNQENTLWQAKITQDKLHNSLLLAQSVKNKTSGGKNTHKKEERNVKRIQQRYLAKSIWKADADSSIASKQINQGLEIVLHNKAGDFRSGKTLRVQVLHNGKGIAAKLLLAKDGASDEEHHYLLREKTNADGFANVRIDSPGLYMLRSKIKQSKAELEAGSDLDSLELSSSFSVYIAP